MGYEYSFKLSKMLGKISTEDDRDTKDQKINMRITELDDIETSGLSDIFKNKYRIKRWVKKQYCIFFDERPVAVMVTEKIGNNETVAAHVYPAKLNQKLESDVKMITCFFEKNGGAELDRIYVYCESRPEMKRELCKRQYRQIEHITYESLGIVPDTYDTYVKNLKMDVYKQREHWFAYAYEKLNNSTTEAKFLLSILGNSPRKVLEIGCGGGKLLMPLAAAGHIVTGVDVDESMLEILSDKASGYSNVQFFCADALHTTWSGNFDVIVVAGNLLMNLRTEEDSKSAQKQLLEKASNILAPGGMLYLDFNMYVRPERVFSSNKERIVFEVCDDTGTYGKYSVLCDEYNVETQLLKSTKQTILKPSDEEVYINEEITQKYMPTFDEVKAWLEQFHFRILEQYGAYDYSRISKMTQRAIIVAQKD